MRVKIVNAEGKGLFGGEGDRKSFCLIIFSMKVMLFSVYHLKLIRLLQILKRKFHFKISNMILSLSITLTFIISFFILSTRKDHFIKNKL